MKMLKKNPVAKLPGINIEKALFSPMVFHSRRCASKASLNDLDGAKDRGILLMVAVAEAVVVEAAEVEGVEAEEVEGEVL
jgi:hypothetical protein